MNQPFTFIMHIVCCYCPEKPSGIASKKAECTDYAHPQPRASTKKWVRAGDSVTHLREKWSCCINSKLELLKICLYLNLTQARSTAEQIKRETAKYGMKFSCNFAIHCAGQRCLWAWFTLTSSHLAPGALEQIYHNPDHAYTSDSPPPPARHRSAGRPSLGNST